MRRGRVLLGDDHTLVIEGFRRILEVEFDVVGAVEDGKNLVSEALRLKPDVILIDISLPILNGIEARTPDQERRAGSEDRLPHDARGSHVFAGRSSFGRYRISPKELGWTRIAGSCPPSSGRADLFCARTHREDPCLTT